MDLCLVVPNSTPPRFVHVSGQLVSLLPVGFLTSFCFICLFIYLQEMFFNTSLATSVFFFLLRLHCLLFSLFIVGNAIDANTIVHDR